LLTHHAREEVPEVLNSQSATASAGSTSADIAAACAAGLDKVDAAQAAKRPLAGTGAGAFAREGTCMSEGKLTGFRTSEVAVLVIPRLRRAAAAGAGSGLVGTGLEHASAGVAGGGVNSGQVSPVNGRTITTQQFENSQKFDNSKQFNNLITRSYPVIPGGLGLHPAREPDPV
jgi:hypothetical protein